MQKDILNYKQQNQRKCTLKKQFLNQISSFFVDKCEEPKSLKFCVCPILSYFRLRVIEKRLYCYSAAAPLLYIT